MIFDCIYLARPSPLSYLLSITEKADNDDIVLGYIIDDLKTTLLDSWYQKSVFKTGGRFCVALRSSVFDEDSVNKSADAVIHHLGSVFFSPQYFTLNDKPILVVLLPQKEETRSNVSSLLEVLKVIFDRLGFELFYYCFMNESGDLVSTNLPASPTIYNDERIDTGNGISGWYSDLLNSSTSSQRVIIFLPTRKLPFEKIVSDLKNTEDKLRESQPQLFSLLEQGKQLKRQLEQSAINIQGLKNELDSKRTYVANLHIPETTLKKVVDFYYYEYEILPLWYKRLGHIIKAIMGKRTFRSLFSDKVKKYKD